MTKPTIRELLDEVMRDEIGRAESAPELAERVEAVLRICEGRAVDLTEGGDVTAELVLRTLDGEPI